MTLSKTFEKTAKEEGGGGSENSKKIRYLRRDTIVDDPLDVQFRFRNINRHPNKWCIASDSRVKKQ